MFVIDAMVVEHILAIVLRPLLGIDEFVNFCAGASVWQKNVNNFTLVIAILVASILSANSSWRALAIASGGPDSMISLLGRP